MTISLLLAHATPSCLNPTHQPSLHIIDRSNQYQKGDFTVQLWPSIKKQFLIFKSHYKYIRLS